MSYLAVFEWHAFNKETEDIPALWSGASSNVAVFNAGTSVLTVIAAGTTLPIGFIPPGGSYQVIATPKITLTPASGKAVGFWLRYGA
jgi:hypothetical protein